MPKTPTTQGTSRGSEAERVRATPPEGSERTRALPVYVPRVDIVETEDALEVLADMPGATRDSVEVTLEQRRLTIRGTRRPAAEQEATYHRRAPRKRAFSPRT